MSQQHVVGCEFDKFRVDPHLCTLRDTGTTYFGHYYGLTHDMHENMLVVAAESPVEYSYYSYSYYCCSS